MATQAWRDGARLCFGPDAETDEYVFRALRLYASLGRDLRAHRRRQDARWGVFRTHLARLLTHAEERVERRLEECSRLQHGYVGGHSSFVFVFLTLRLSTGVLSVLPWMETVS